jgi:hypothetical protein
MKKLSRKEIKNVTGGVVGQSYQWRCYSSEAGGYYLTCADVDPTAHCAPCGYSDCVNTGVSCNWTTACAC